MGISDAMRVLNWFFLGCLLWTSGVCGAESTDTDGVGCESVDSVRIQQSAPVKDISTQIPNRPSTPPQLAPRSSVDSFGCKREYAQRGENHPVDSFHKRDAERLRALVAGVTAAELELDAYQANRRRVKFAAYTGTIGLLVALVSSMVASRTTDPQLAQSFRYIGIPVGLGMVGGSFALGYFVLSSNETHVQKAVEFHNQARPEKKIQLEFSTGIF